MPVFGIGTWLMGGDKSRNPHNNDKKDTEAVRTAIELGITHIDTAENYAEGWAEKIVGEAIKDVDRSSLFLVSKVDRSHLHYNDLIAAAKKSLERLCTTYLDLYLIHAPNNEIAIEETMSAMDALVEEGLVRYIGVSNFKTARLVEAQKHTANPIVTNQVYYNIKMREPEKEGLLEHCQKHDVILTAYRPVDKGALLHDVPPVLRDVCERYEKTPVQIMMKWLISQPNIVTISKMSDKKHMEENLEIFGWHLEEGDLEKLKKEYPAVYHSETLPLR